MFETFTCSTNIIIAGHSNTCWRLKFLDNLLVTCTMPIASALQIANLNSTSVCSD